MIHRCLQDLWKARTKPKPLELTELVPIAPVGSTLNGHANGDESAAGQAASASAALGLTDDHAMWSTADNAKVIKS